jgi:hypothetical protein
MVRENNHFNSNFNSASMATRIRTHLPQLLTGLCAFILLIALGRSLLLFLDYQRIVIAFPYNLDYGEGPILDQVMRLARFENIYRQDLTQPPYTIGNYPPVYQLLQIPFAWLFGPAFWYGRLINLISLVAAAVFIFLILHTVTQDWLAAAVGGLLLLANPYILHWSGFVRVDSLALGVSWAGLYCLVRWPDQRKGLVWGAIFLTAAIFTRQSYGLAAPLAGFVWLLARQPRRRAFELAVWTGGFSLTFFVICNLLSNGGFSFNIITANVNPFFWETVRNYATRIWEKMGVLVFSGAVYMLAAVWTRNKIWWLAAPYALAATASAVTIGKDGSNVNYLFEFSAGLAILAGAVLAWAGQAWQVCALTGGTWIGRRWWLVSAIMLILAGQVSQLYDWSKDEYYRWPVERAQREAEEIAGLVQYVRDAPGAVLADEFMGLIPLAGKNLGFQPFEFKQLVTGNLWDETPFINAITNREYDLILLFDPSTWDSAGARWTPAQLAALRSHYVEIDRLANTRVYAPLDIKELIK